MITKNKQFKVPEEALNVVKTLKDGGFEAYLIGGCVRDLFLDREPRDWDVTTNAKPEQIEDLFEKTVYENNFGTVAVVNEDVSRETLKIIEITPYRLESAYSDNRRPDSVDFSDNLEDDLHRRDFTCNAIALDPTTNEVVDPHKGQKAIEQKTIQTVGDPDKRFGEDALRMLRGIRLHVELDFAISRETQKAIENNAKSLESISNERIRDEFTRIIMSDYPANGIDMAQKLGLLKYFLPEVEAGMGVEQPQAHAYDVYTHLLKSLQHSAKKNYPLHVRLAALFHDIAKPETRRRQGNKWTFYGHDVVGARVTREIMKRLKFPKDLSKIVIKLVRWHMFFSDTDEVSLSAVRRLIQNVSRENIWDLLNLRYCDRIGTGRPKEQPYRLRKFKSMIDEVLRDPISVGMLEIDGNILISELHMKPGPRIGWILHALLEDVIEDPTLNEVGKLKDMANKLAELPDDKLKQLGEKGVKRRDQEDEKLLEKIRKKHWVK